MLAPDPARVRARDRWHDPGVAPAASSVPTVEANHGEIVEGQFLAYLTTGDSNGMEEPTSSRSLATVALVVLMG